jgi:hypothetical protein
MGMNTNPSCRWLCGLLPLVALVAVGCDPEVVPNKTAPAPTTAAPAPAKKVEIGKNVFLEVQGDRRRVLLNAYVCLRQGQLEQLLCRRQTKEHEAILAADVDAQKIHAALLLARAEAGSPVKFVPKFQPARGTTIKITLQYQDKGKTVTVPARQWVRDVNTKKDLAYDWVFAGSVLIPDPLDKTVPPFYGANDGDVICVSNFDTALLDLPINSSKDNADLAFEANTERIPAVETPVLVILEPVLAKKK